MMSLVKFCVWWWWRWKCGWQEFYSVGEKALSCRINQNFPPFVRRPTILCLLWRFTLQHLFHFYSSFYRVLLLLIWRKKNEPRDIFQGLIEAKVTIYLLVCIWLNCIDFPNVHAVCKSKCSAFIRCINLTVSQACQRQKADANGQTLSYILGVGKHCRTK